jgi:hypothetical protein
MEQDEYLRHAATSPSSPSMHTRHLSLGSSTNEIGGGGGGRRTSSENTVTDAEEAENHVLTAQPMPIRQRRTAPSDVDLLDTEENRQEGNHLGRRQTLSLAAYPFVGSPMSYNELENVDRSPASLTALAQPIKFPSVEEAGTQQPRLAQRDRASTSPSVMRGLRTGGVAPIAEVTMLQPVGTIGPSSFVNPMVASHPINIPGLPRPAAPHLTPFMNIQQHSQADNEQEEPGKQEEN